MFVYTGESRYLSAYFTEVRDVRHKDQALAQITGSGDPSAVYEPILALAERAETLRDMEYHAMKLAALSYGLDLTGFPEEVRDYPLTESEDRLNSEQKRDDANALLYGDTYCQGRSIIDIETELLLSGAENAAEERVRELSDEIDISLLIQRILLGVSVAAVALLIVYLKRQRERDARYEASRREELEAAKNRAEAEDRTKSAFLLNISHDIRMPMNEIIGFTNLAQKYIADSERVEESLGKIKSSSVQLLNIINDILELNRIENSALEIRETPADIMRSGEEIQPFFLAQAESKGIDYALVIGAVTDRYVYVDIMHMVRVLVNLVSNAFRFTPEGGKVRLEIDQCAPMENGWAKYRFTVSDTGIGMKPEFVQRLFDPYAREKNPEATAYGAGLGLTITKKLVDCMHGSIQVESEPGKGSVFTVTMPFRVQTEEEVEEHYSVDPRTGRPPAPRYTDIKGMRVLLADDNELAREITAEILRGEGAATEKALNGADALRLFTERPAGYYGLILLDTQMPVMNGFEAASQIRALDSGKDVPIIAIASAPWEEDTVNAGVAGMNAVLTKPLDMSELTSVLRRTLRDGHPIYRSRDREERKYKSMKKVWSLLLCLVLLVSACGAAFADGDIAPGVYEDGDYWNREAGIRFSLPEDWSFMTQEELETSMGLAGVLAGNDAFREALQRGLQLTLAVAAGPDGSSFSVVAAPMDKSLYALFREKGEKEVLKKLMPSLLQNYEDMGMSIGSGKVSSVSVGLYGEDIPCIKAVVYYFGTRMTMIQFFRFKEDVLYSCTALAEDYMEEILENITVIV